MSSTTCEEKNVTIWNQKRTNSFQIIAKSYAELCRETAKRVETPNIQLAIASDLTIIGDPEYFDFLSNDIDLVYLINENVSSGLDREEHGESEIVDVSDGLAKASLEEVDEEEEAVKRILRKLEANPSAISILPLGDIQLLADADKYTIQLFLRTSLDDVEEFQEMCFDHVQERQRRRDQVDLVDVISRAIGGDTATHSRGEESTDSPQRQGIKHHSVGGEFRLLGGNPHYEGDVNLAGVMKKLKETGLHVVHSLTEAELKTIADATTKDLTSVSSDEFIVDLKNTCQDLASLKRDQSIACDKLNMISQQRLVSA